MSRPDRKKMARWIKSALFTLAGIAFLCILVLCFVLATFDDDDYRRLAIDPFRMACSVGYTDFNAVIDASGTVPRYDIKIAGEDIDVDDLLAR